MKFRPFLFIFFVLNLLNLSCWFLLCYLIAHDEHISAALAVLPHAHMSGLLVKGACLCIVFTAVLTLFCLRVIDVHEQRYISMITGVAHDIKSPIATICGYLETVISKYDVMSDSEQRDFLETAYRRSKKLGELVLDLLESLEPSKIKGSMTRSPFSLSEVTSRAVTHLLEESQSRKVTFEFDDLSKAAQVLGDAKLIERAIGNIIHNAVRYSFRDSVVKISLSTKCTIWGKGEKCFLVVLKVKDAGVGMSRAELGQIFQRFYRGFSAKQKEPKGSGLGLAISKSVVEAHDGAIRFRSYPYSGTEVEISLPLHETR